MLEVLSEIHYTIIDEADTKLCEFGDAAVLSSSNTIVTFHNATFHIALHMTLTQL